MLGNIPQHHCEPKVEEVFGVAVNTPQRRRWSQRTEQTVIGYLCLLPTFAYAAVFLVFPVIFSLVLSFRRWPMFGPKKFVGWENYIRIFQDDLFWLGLKNAGRYTIAFVPLSIITSLFVALLLNTKIRGINFYRTGYFIPTITSAVAVAVVWTFLFDTNYGLVNDWLIRLGFERVGWLSDPKVAMWSIVLFSIWRGLGYNVVIYLAALQGVPVQLYEAAKIDGAGWWAQFRYITLPMVSPTTFFMFIMGIIGSIQVFEQIFIMTGGGPMRSTYVVFMYMYDYAFRYNEMGYAAAVGYIMAVLIFILTLINMKVTGKSVHYDQA